MSGREGVGAPGPAEVSLCAPLSGTPSRGAEGRATCARGRAREPAGWGAAGRAQHPPGPLAPFVPPARPGLRAAGRRSLPGASPRPLGSGLEREWATCPREFPSALSARPPRRPRPAPGGPAKFSGPRHPGCWPGARRTRSGSRGWGRRSDVRLPACGTPVCPCGPLPFRGDRSWSRDGDRAALCLLVNTRL